MKKRSADPARVHDAARLLPILGVVLLMPPVVALFVSDARVGGVPLIVVYVFGTWLALIACAAWRARALAKSAAEKLRRDGDQG
jgi:putative effector of murein hydrolase LrgA (UPF0299 family)